MISITCTQCRTLLTIDDAFAGGVCRCQHCGTIQTVPKPGSVPSPHFNPAGTSKALYQNQSSPRTTGGNVATTGATSPSGLDDLAQAVVSSGLSGSGLRSSRLTGEAGGATSVPRTPQAKLADIGQPPTTEAAPKKLPIVPLAIGGGVVLLALIIAIVIYATRGGNPPPAQTQNATPPPPPAAPIPSFSGVQLNGSTIIYVIDRGNSLHGENFDKVKAAVYDSIKTIGRDGNFAVIFWRGGKNAPDIAFPKDGVVRATKDQVDELARQIQDLQATGAANLRVALEKAIARNPTSIVLITGKPSRLNDDDENSLANSKEIAQGKFKIYAVAIGLGNPSFKLAAGSTLEYYKITIDDLH